VFHRREVCGVKCSVSAAELNRSME
jgi:hypothetical protein